MSCLACRHRTCTLFGIQHQFSFTWRLIVIVGRNNYPCLNDIFHNYFEIIRTLEIIKPKTYATMNLVMLRISFLINLRLMLKIEMCLLYRISIPNLTFMINVIFAKVMHIILFIAKFTLPEKIDCSNVKLISFV